jgi:hypothetical protein
LNPAQNVIAKRIIQKAGVGFDGLVEADALRRRTSLGR